MARICWRLIQIRFGPRDGSTRAVERRRLRTIDHTGLSHSYVLKEKQSQQNSQTSHVLSPNEKCALLFTALRLLAPELWLPNLAMVGRILSKCVASSARDHHF